MELRGRIKYTSATLDGMDMILSVNAADLEGLKDKELRITLKQYRQGRSRNANAYFYALVGKLADALKVSKAYVHNLMLRKYGQIETIDDRPVWVILPDTDETALKVDEDESIHLRPTSEVKEGKDKRMYRTYLLLKGSHQFDTKEMSILIDGIIEECKAAGISTLPTTEIEAMKQMWCVELE